MSTGPKNGWGGARPGAGRPRQTLTAQAVQEMHAAAKRYAKKYGKTIDDVLLSIIYDDKGATRDKLAAVKLFKEYTIAKLQEGGETDQALGPQVYIPQADADPATVVPIKKQA